MNYGFLLCSISGLFFLLLALLFTALRGKAAMLISGFNTLPKEKQALYDQEKMARDQRNAFLLWAAVYGAGAVFSHRISSYLAIAAFVAWLILFIKDVHWDTEIAFGKYKKQQ